jgi:hypothetical protein
MAKMSKKEFGEGKNDKRRRYSSEENELNMQKLWKFSKYWSPVVEFVF